MFSRFLRRYPAVLASQDVHGREVQALRWGFGGHCRPFSAQSKHLQNAVSKMESDDQKFPTFKRIVPKGVKKKERAAQRASPVLAEKVNRRELSSLRRAIENADLESVIKNYPVAMKKKILSARDSWKLAQGFHHAIRSSPNLEDPRHNPQEAKALENHFAEFVELYQRTKLPPHPLASLHIICAYRDKDDYEGGLVFWDWVAHQGDEYSNLATYGAAIELLAAHGQPLDVCEEIYLRGLKRFQSGFNEYLLSSGAVLSQPHLPITATGTSTTLLQGILNARLVHGDWKGAYQSLDRALQLHPNQVPTQMFRMFLGGRPYFESAQIYCLLCLGGSRTSPSDLTVLLKKLRSLQISGRSGKLDRKVALSILCCVRYAFQTGKELGPMHMDLLLSGILNLIPRPLHVMDDTEELAVRQAFLGTKTCILSIFARSGIRPDRSSYASMLSQASRIEDGYLVRHVVEEYLDSDMARAVGNNNSELLMTMLAEAAKVGDAELGNAIKLHFEEEAFVLPTLIRRTLFKPHPYEWKAMFGPVLESANELRSMPLDKILDLETNSPESLEKEFALVTSEEDWQNQLYADLHLDPLKAFNSASTTATANNSADETFPNKLKLEQSREDTVLAPGALMSTGLNIGDLRKRNWKGINDLLLLADSFDRLGVSGFAPLSEQAAACHAIIKSPDDRVTNEQDWRQLVLELRSETSAHVRSG